MLTKLLKTCHLAADGQGTAGKGVGIQGMGAKLTGQQLTKGVGAMLTRATP